MTPYVHRSTPVTLAKSPALWQLALELERDVRMLATEIGPRGTHSPRAYQIAEEFLTTVLTRAGHGVRRQTWTTQGVRCANLEVILPGTVHPERVLVVGAHYDSVEDCPAANDNASGVAGVLALARRLAGRPRNATVRLVLFANEEPPFFNMDEMGSQLYARAARDAGDDIRGMFCLETIGCFSSEEGSQRWPEGARAFELPTTGDFVAMVGPEAGGEFIHESVRGGV